MRDRAGSQLRRAGWMMGLWLMFAGLSTVVVRAYDMPAPRAARLSYLQGNVTVVRMDNTGNDPAQLNMPLAEGLRVTTGQNGQAEIEFEDGSVVRLTPSSSLALDSLKVSSDGTFQTQVALVRGLVYAELRAAAKYKYRLNVAGLVVSPVENATVRISLDQPPPEISVLSGTVHVEHPGSQEGQGYRTDVRAGESLSGDAADSGRYLLNREIPEESWDRWNEERDQAAADEAATRTAARDNYAGDQGYGWSDLDANGNWYDVPGQGRVWQPNAAMDASFDPYGYGSWVWYPGAGYVWASGYGWGWTPYRCGSWSYWNGFGWGWMPGGTWGFGGWGSGGGGYVINVVRPPRDYRLIPLPVRSPGGVHPIVVAHPGHVPSMAVQSWRGPRTIEGHEVEPLRPLGGGGYTFRGGSAIGSSLQRDFPVDRNNHQPVMGVVSAPGGNGVSRPGPDWKAGASRVEDGVKASPGQQPARQPPSVYQSGDAIIRGVHPSQGPIDRMDRPASRIEPPAQTYYPGLSGGAAGAASQSRPAPPNPVARPITPQVYQAPRPMPPMQRSEPAPMQRSMPSAPAQPQRITPPSAPSAAPRSGGNLPSPR